MANLFTMYFLALFVLCALGAQAEDDADNPFQFTSHAPTCAVNSTLREARLAAIKDAILAKLHLTEAPRNPRKLTRINRSTYAAYEAAAQTARFRAEQRPQECRRDTFFAKQIAVFVPTSYIPVIPPADVFDWGPIDIVARRGVDESVYHNYIPPTSYRLTFSLNELENNAMIWSSDLRIFKHKRSISGLKPMKSIGSVLTENVEIYYITHILTSTGQEMRNLVLVTSKDVDTQFDKYESFDVTSAIRTCIAAGKKDLELEVVIQCPRSIVTGLAILPTIEFVTESSKENRTAQLVVATLRREETQIEDASVSDDEYNEVHRRKRGSEIDNQFCLAHQDEPNCCLRKLTINFRRDFGWSWIIAPRKFTPNYCQGFCPLFWPTATSSTSLLIRYREQNPTAAVEPCCVASSLRPLTLLMVIRGRVFLEELSDMIVDSCICR